MTLKDWTIKRSGDCMTITHAAGKLVNVLSVSNGIARTKDGREFRLS